MTCLKFINDDEAPIFEIKGHSGNTLLGGDDLDNILVDYCIIKFEKEYNRKGSKKDIEINKESKEGLYAIKRLKIFCEKKKIDYLKMIKPQFVFINYMEEKIFNWK